MMNEMYKVLRGTPDQSFALGTATRHESFEQAKAAMHAAIVEQFSPLLPHYIQLIDDYCTEYHPWGTPDEVTTLKQLLTELFTNPAALDEVITEKYDDLRFDDGHVRFRLSYIGDLDGEYLYLNIEAEGRAYGVFPEGAACAFRLEELIDPDSTRTVTFSVPGEGGVDLEFSLLSEDDEDAYEFVN